MAITLSGLLKLALLTVQQPRLGARVVLGEGLPNPTRWMALAFTAVASALSIHLTLALMPPSEVPADVIVPGPVMLAVLQGGVMVLTALAAWQIGRWRGGRGRIEDAVLLMAWLQFIMLCLQVIQIVVMLGAPLLGDLIGLSGIVLFLWLLTAFVAELHGFSSLPAVFAGILGTIFAVALLLSLVLASAIGAPV